MDGDVTRMDSGHRRPMVVLCTVAVLVIVGGVAGARAIVPAASAKSSAVPTTPLRNVLQATLDIPNESWLAFYAGYVWVKRDDGFVERIDPRSNTSTGRVGKFTGADDYCQGIGAGGGAVWSCSKSSITRIDPKRMKIVKTIPVGKVFNQGRLVAAAGRIWVVSGVNGDRLTGIDMSTNRPGPPIKLPASCADLAQGGPALWVLCPNANKVVKVDAAQHKVVGVVTLADANAGYATATDLWVGSNGALVRLDAKTLRITARFAGLDPSTYGDVAVDGRRVWVRTRIRFLYRLDTKTNRVVEHITADPSFGGGSLLIGAGSLWTGADDVSKLLRLRRSG